MRHLVLPAEYSPTDLRLAGEVMVALRSESLYVAWTHGHGQGAPAVEGVVVEDHDAPLPTVGRLARLRCRMRALLAAVRRAERRASTPAGQDARAFSSRVSSRSS